MILLVLLPSTLFAKTRVEVEVERARQSFHSRTPLPHSFFLFLSVYHSPCSDQQELAIGPAHCNLSLRSHGRTIQAGRSLCALSGRQHFRPPTYDPHKSTTAEARHARALCPRASPDARRDAAGCRCDGRHLDRLRDELHEGRARQAGPALRRRALARQQAQGAEHRRLEAVRAAVRRRRRERRGQRARRRVPLLQAAARAELRGRARHAAADGAVRDGAARLGAARGRARHHGRARDEERGREGHQLQRRGGRRHAARPYEAARRGHRTGGGQGHLPGQHRHLWRTRRRPHRARLLHCIRAPGNLRRGSDGRNEAETRQRWCCR